jgi:hypothetical protein
MKAFKHLAIGLWATLALALAPSPARAVAGALLPTSPAKLKAQIGRVIKASGAQWRRAASLASHQRFAEALVVVRAMYGLNWTVQASIAAKELWDDDPEKLKGHLFPLSVIYDGPSPTDHGIMATFGTYDPNDKGLFPENEVVFIHGTSGHYYQGQPLMLIARVYAVYAWHDKPGHVCYALAMEEVMPIDTTEWGD